MTQEPPRSAACAGILLLVFFVTGCISSSYGWRVRTTSTPMPPSFHPANLEQQPVAVFSGLGPPAFRGSEVALAYYLDLILHKVEPTWKVISSQETATRINRQGLAAEYARMRGDYELTNILDRDSLRKIGGAVGARYVILPRLAAFEQLIQDRWTFPGVNVRVTQTRSSTMRLSLSMWDTETGELVWASMAETNMESEAVSQDPVYLEDITLATLGAMVEDFSNRRTASTYTPLNTFLKNLVRGAAQKETPTGRETHEPVKK